MDGEWIVSGYTSYGRTLMVTRMFIPGTDPITDLYFALTYTVPGTSDSTAALMEPEGMDYARVPVELDGGAFELDGVGQVTNAAAIVWPTPSWVWGMVRGYAATTGPAGDPTSKVVLGNRLPQPKFITAGMVVELPAGSIKLGIRP